MLKQRAGQFDQRDLARTYVAMRGQRPTVLGYYAISSHYRTPRGLARFMGFCCSESVLVEIEDRGIVQILRFGRIDEDDLSWKPIWVRQVDVTVFDHSPIGGESTIAS
jgi:hypothetical protein